VHVSSASVAGVGVLAALLVLAVAPAAAAAAPVAAAAPSPPSLTAGAAGVAVSWLGPDRPPSAVLGYRVELASTATGPWAAATAGTCAALLTAATQNCRAAGLTNGTAYYVRVVALYDQASEAASDPAGPVVPRGLPAAVPAPGVRRDYRAVEVSWEPTGDDGGSPVIGYEVLVRRASDVVWGPPPGGTCRGALLARACRVTGLTGGVRHYVRVRTTTAVGSRGSAPTAVTPLAPGAVTLAFGGDVHFEGSAYARGVSGGLSGLRSVFAGADLSMVNLETAIATRGRPEAKEFVFRAPPRVLRTLAEAGVDVVTMANNHALDFGAEGLGQTLAARATSPVPIVGVGSSLTDSLRPWVATVRGTTIAFLGIVGLDLAQEEGAAVAAGWPARTAGPGLPVWRDHAGPIRRAVARWASAADIVVVYVHWGRERATCSNGAQRAVARALADAGADVVVGSHPHVLQGAGYVGDSLVALSLGNFVWYTSAGRPTAALMVRIRGGALDSYEWRPAAYTETGSPFLVSGAQRQDTLDLIAERSAVGCSGLADQPGTPPSLTALTRGPLGPPPPLTPLEARTTPGRE